MPKITDNFKDLIVKNSKQFKKALKERKRELPSILANLKDHEGILTVIQGNDTLNYFTRVSAVLNITQNLSVWVPELMSPGMAPVCLSLAKKLLENSEGDTADALKDIEERMELIVKSVSKGEVVIHPFKEVVNNLLYSTDSNEPLDLIIESLKNINAQAIKEFESHIENYSRLTL